MANPFLAGSSDADFDLLFGLLSLVDSQVSRESLSRSYEASLSQGGQTFSGFLKEKGWVGPTEVAPSQGETGKGDAGGAKPSLPVTEKSPSSPPPNNRHDETVDFRSAPRGSAGSQARLGHLRPDSPASRVFKDRYNRIQLHAQGGVGEVWLSRDERLGREVALKVLKARFARSASAQARFVEEAKVASQLQHPGIVPIYDLTLGSGDQSPFYTMRFLKGRTLSEAIVSYHKRLRKGEAGVIDLRELLGSLLAVCQAIAYAHSRGVLHRDLKGQNIILGDFGEVMVLDWGLAKILGAARPTGEEPSTPPADDLLHLDKDDSREETAQGAVLGTPGYMSPEQAEGRLDELDSRTDVYGLGAVLYSILTGEAPFKGGGTTQVLAMVSGELPPSPRRLVPSVDPAIEAICLKCLAKDPDDRYPTATDMARDIQRYLADEPVSAYAEPWTTRARRWFQRHHTLTIALAATLAVATVVSIAAAMLLGAANRREATARSQAEDHFQLARDAVDRFFTKVSNDPRLKAHGLEKLRQDLLKQAQGFYEKLVEARSPDDRVRADRGLTYIQLARITGELGEIKEAIALGKQACAIFAELTARRPKASNVREGLAEAELTLANLYLNNYQPLEARPELEKASEQWHTLEGLNPLEIRYLYNRIRTLNRLGKAIGLHMWKPDEGEQKLTESLALCRNLLDLDPRNPLYQDEKAEAQMLLGFLRFTTNFESARDLFDSALKIRETIAANHPSEPQYQSNLVDTCAFIAVSYYNANDPEHVDSILNLIRPISQRLVKDHPDVAVYVENDALITTLYAASRVKRGEHLTVTPLVEEATRRAPDSGILSLYAACFYAMAADQARADSSLSAEERERIVEMDYSRAMEALRRARRTGLFQQTVFMQGLRNDPDLNPLRGRNDFQTFLAEVESEAPAGDR